MGSGGRYPGVGREGEEVTPHPSRPGSEPRPIKPELPHHLFHIENMLAQTQFRWKPRACGVISHELLNIYEHRKSGEIAKYRVPEIRALAGRRSEGLFAGVIARTLFQCELLMFPLGEKLALR